MNNVFAAKVMRSLQYLFDNLGLAFKVILPASFLLIGSRTLKLESLTGSTWVALRCFPISLISVKNS